MANPNLTIGFVNGFMRRFKEFECVGDKHDALEYFNRLIQKRPLPPVHYFTRLLVFLTNVKEFSGSLDFFKQMCAIGVPVNNYTAGIAIKCYSRLHHTKQGFTVLGYCFKQGIVPHVSCYNTILNGFIHEDKTHEAERLFSKLFMIKNQINVVTYNTMVKGLCKIGNNFTAIALLRLMEGRGCKPNVVTYNTIIHSLCKDVITIHDALKLFKQMKMILSTTPTTTTTTYNSLIYALCKLGRWDEVSNMLKQMMAGGGGQRISLVQVSTFNIIVDALCKQGKIKEATHIINNIMVKSGRGYPPDIVTYNSLIHGYCLQGQMSEARTIFDLLAVRGLKPNVITYFNLLNGYCYCNNKNIFETIDMYHTLYTIGDKPTHDMVVNYIASLGRLSWDIRQIKAGFGFKPTDDEMHPQPQPKPNPYRHLLKYYHDEEDALDSLRRMDGSKLNSYIEVYNILIDGASKCGKFDTIRRLFHDLFVQGLQPDVETYRLMITGLSRGGLLKDAKRLFSKMEKRGFPPDSVVYNDLLQGYFKNKTLDHAVILLQEMKGKGYVMNPSSYYLAVIQLIARQPAKRHSFCSS